MAFLAYKFHWDRNKVLRLPILERKMWVEQAMELHRKENDENYNPMMDAFEFLDKCPPIKKV